MTDNDRISIRLRIGSNIHQLTVPTEKEEVFRRAAELINDRLNKYQQGFQNQSTERYNAVVMLDIAVRYLQQQNDLDTLPFMQSIEQLTGEIEEGLGEDNKKH